MGGSDESIIVGPEVSCSLEVVESWVKRVRSRYRVQGRAPRLVFMNM